MPRSLLERVQSFPDFHALPEPAARDLQAGAQVQRAGADTLLALQGAPCEFFPLVLSGRARIFVTDLDGRQITLYRLGPGQGCVLAAACSVSDEPLPGSVVVEASGEGLFIPAPVLRAWVERHPFWRSYVFSLIARQLGQVVAITNDLAFRHLDSRIAGFLLQEAAETGGVVQTTHQSLALELGTRREVASRILKSFEHDGLVRLERGAVRLLDREALQERAGECAPAAVVGDKSN
ncbi:MAG: Crp/Fnr family transcriptional regulator [Acidobacteria bacterium]|nr:Crp/Fnr family transcriptional regulator [Acidobacteriota bacterium]